MTQLGQMGGEKLLEGVAGVVGTDRDAHARSIPTPLAGPGGSPRPDGTLRPVPLDPRTPVLVGAGQVTERRDPAVALGDRPEPVELMARALRAAADDSGAPSVGRRLLERAQTLRVMVPLSWPYVNPGLLVAERLGIAPAELALTVIGGNNPQTVVSRTATEILDGRLDVALLTGAECTATVVAARRQDVAPRLVRPGSGDAGPRPDG